MLNLFKQMTNVLLEIKNEKQQEKKMITKLSNLL